MRNSLRQKEMVLLVATARSVAPRAKVQRKPARKDVRISCAFTWCEGFDQERKLAWMTLCKWYKRKLRLVPGDYPLPFGSAQVGCGKARLVRPLTNPSSGVIG